VEHEDVVSDPGGATSPPAAEGCAALLPRCRGDTKRRPANRSGAIRPDQPRVHLPGRDGTRPARCVRSTVESAHNRTVARRPPRRKNTAFPRCRGVYNVLRGFDFCPFPVTGDKSDGMHRLGFLPILMRELQLSFDTGTFCRRRIRRRSPPRERRPQGVFVLMGAVWSGAQSPGFRPRDARVWTPAAVAEATSPTPEPLLLSTSGNSTQGCCPSQSRTTA